MVALDLLVVAVYLLGGLHGTPGRSRATTSRSRSITSQTVDQEAPHEGVHCDPRVGGFGGYVK